MKRKCKHCGRSFDTRLVDVDRHEESCKQHNADVRTGNIDRFWRGKAPTRDGR